MQHIHMICIGKLKERFYIDACAEYQKRLARHCALTVTELPEQRLPENPSASDILRALDQEAGAISGRLPRGGAVIALCIEGELLSSEQFADTIGRYAARGVSPLTFLVGGSYGLSEGVKRAAARRISMSPMTFPHHLARVMLLEQLYRAYQIGAGSKYHK